MNFGKPNYQHDCDTCIFLGTYNNHDLYFCNPCGTYVSCTVIARYGNEPHEYKSGLKFGTWRLTKLVPRMYEDGSLDFDYERNVNVLRIAYMIAKDLNIIPID
jgi:hypothetical protein